MAPASQVLFGFDFVKMYKDWMWCFINSKGLQGVSYSCMEGGILHEFSEVPES